MSKKTLIYSGIVLIAIIVIPMILKSAGLKIDRKNENRNQGDLQCKAITASGKRCKRQSLPNRELCWQHQD